MLATKPVVTGPSAKTEVAMATTDSLTAFTATGDGGALNGTVKTTLSFFSDTNHTNENLAASKTYRSLIVKQNDAVVGIAFIKM
ncbi:hypothetical protein D3C76_1402410 [compost metagenome]